MILQEIQQLDASARIELFELYMGDIAPELSGDDRYLRFTAQTNELGEAVTWNGKAYSPYPIFADGFEINAQGSPPRPKLRAANIGGALSSLCLGYNDLVLAKLTLIKTFARFLDAVNFSAGNPDADPAQHFPLEKFLIERKTEENDIFIEWELRWPYDLQGVTIPARPIIQNLCPTLYKSADCGWVPVAGKYFNAADAATDAAGDTCSQALTGCKPRFGAKSVLPFGGFPGAGMVRR